MAYFKSKVEFEAAPMKVGSGWFVRVTPPVGKELQLGGFKTEDEARVWIAQKATAWLREHENGAGGLV